MRKSPKLSPEVVELAVRMVFDAKDQYPSQWAAIKSIAGKIGCTAEQRRVNELEREMRELRRVNEILKFASTFFAQAELDRRSKS